MPKKPPAVLPPDFDFGSSAPQELPADFNFGVSTPQQAPPTASIGASKQPQSFAQRAEQFASDAVGDVQYGTDKTPIGAFLKKMGAQGTRVGSQADAGDFMGSPVTGALNTARGVAIQNQPGRRWEGTKAIASGVGETATIPGMVIAPGGAAAAPGVAGKLVPNTARAGENFADVMGQAGKIPVEIKNVGDVALRTQELAKSGGKLPKVIGDFLRRTTDPTKAPLTYAEARDFYSNASRLSVDEFNRLTPIMKRQVTEFTAQLGSAIKGAAESVGMGDQYLGAMNEYRKAMRIGSSLSSMGDAFAKYLKYGVPGAAAAYGAKKIIDGK